MQSSGKRSAGLLLPAFSPRRKGDLGIGDTRAMTEWIDWAANHHVGFLQLLPINANGKDDSPYNSISSVALEPIYLTCDGGEIPGLVEEEVDAERAALGQTWDDRLTHYAAVRAAKTRLLELAWARFPDADPALREEFDQFRAAEAEWLGDYCAYRWLMERNGGTEAWDAWPDDSNTPATARALIDRARRASSDAVEARMGFFAFVQWLCFRQWRGVRAHADRRGVKLMGDVPIGISWNSADVFFRQEDFELEWGGGAPPETMFKHDRFIQQWGQNWGIPVYRWEKMEAEGFPWWRQRIKKLTEIFNMFRIDHILGFYRIYAFPWRPQRNIEFLDLSPEEAAKKTGGLLPKWHPRPDDTEEHKALNRAEGDRRLRALLEAAGDAEVVGEDLGCVPDYVRPHLQSLDIAGFRIPHWDCDAEDRAIAGTEFPECAFATYATHDHDSIAAMWNTFAAAANHCHGKSCHGDEASAAVDAARNLRLLCEFASIPQPSYGPWPTYSETIQWRLIKALFASNSRYAAIMITDLYAMEDRFNQPGTVGGENWRLRLPWLMSEIQGDPRLKEMSKKLAALIGVTGRA
jgi:4-alpha-glucanotransferase